MQHPAVAQDNEALIETIAIRLRLVENLLAPIANRLENFLTECANRYWIDQRCRVRSSQHEPVITEHTSHNKCVAVIGPHQGLASVVEIPELLPAHVRIAQCRHREIRSLQVLRPRGPKCEDAPMDCLQRTHLIAR